jgi:hypothetical protein
MEADLATSCALSTTWSSGLFLRERLFIAQGRSEPWAARPLRRLLVQPSRERAVPPSEATFAKLDVAAYWT